MSKLLTLVHKKYRTTTIIPPQFSYFAYYDPSDLSSLSQTFDGVVGNVNIGDPVGRIEDQSGNGRHLTQSVTAARPTLAQTSDGKYYLNFNGTSQYIRTEGTGINFDLRNRTIAMAIEENSISSLNAGIFSILPGITSGTVLSGTDWISANGLSINTGTSDLFVATASSTTYTAFVSCLGRGTINPMVVVEQFSVGNFGSIKVNGEIIETDTTGVSSATSGSYGFQFGKRQPDNIYFAGRLYGLVINNSVLDSSELQTVENWLYSRLRYMNVVGSVTVVELVGNTTPTTYTLTFDNGDEVVYPLYGNTTPTTYSLSISDS